MSWLIGLLIGLYLMAGVVVAKVLNENRGISWREWVLIPLLWLPAFIMGSVWEYLIEPVLETIGVKDEGLRGMLGGVIFLGTCTWVMVALIGWGVWKMENRMITKPEIQYEMGNVDMRDAREKIGRLLRLKAFEKQIVKRGNKQLFVDMWKQAGEFDSRLLAAVHILRGKGAIYGIYFDQPVVLSRRNRDVLISHCLFDQSRYDPELKDVKGGSYNILN